MSVLPFNQNQADAIRQLFIKTFTDSESETEGRLIGRLVQDIMTTTAPEDLYGFVAMEDNSITGCIFFTRLKAAGAGKVFLLSPVAVHTDYQGKGTGQRLIRHGLDQLKAAGISLVITYGDPDFYGRTGFQVVSDTTLKPPFSLSQPEGWLAQSLNGEPIRAMGGRLNCVAAFNNPALW